MDSLSIPFGQNAGHLEVSEDGAQVLLDAFELPQDGRTIAREHIPSLIAWLEEYLETTRQHLPELPHATIRATLIGGEERVLTLLEPCSGTPWAAHDGDHAADWFEGSDIESFEVLFEGIDD